jgi:hypothetical protein
VRKKYVECNHKGMHYYYAQGGMGHGREMDGWMDGIHHSIEDGVSWLQDQTIIVLKRKPLFFKGLM